MASCHYNMATTSPSHFEAVSPLQMGISSFTSLSLSLHYFLFLFITHIISFSFFVAVFFSTTAHLTDYGLLFLPLQLSLLLTRGMNTDLFGQHALRMRSKLMTEWSFRGGSRVITGPNIQKCVQHRKDFGVHASWFTNPQIASSVFTIGTVAVLPFYTLMVVAPKAELTKRSIDSTIPYVALGLLYAYLLYLSWTPDTIRLMFASQYWLPELTGIARMFSNEMTLASAWIHLLAVDLFAARQVFQDGLENKVETRHSISLCLLFCPIGIVAHVITKVLTTSTRNTRREIH